MGYTRAEIIDKCSQAIAEVNTFYTRGFINYTGKTIDTRELYTEVVAEFILDNIEVFKEIEPIKRIQCYKKKHKGHYKDDSCRKEEIEAMMMFNQCQDGLTIGQLGTIIDYQIPLKGKMKDKAGKIDLLSMNDEAVYVLEFKRKDNVETLLRCVLEGYTYLRQVDKEKLYKDYDIADRTLPLRTAPLIYEKSAQWYEHSEMKNGLRPKLQKLMKELGDDEPIEPFFVKKIYTAMNHK